MTTITPTRFGLKYAPIPTLALEYEEHLDVVEDDSGTRSLYVYKDTSTKPSTKMIRKKLHVVELPHLTSHSEPQTIAQQLQKDNQRFLGPSVVKEQQLRRLLQQLVDKLRSTDSAGGGAPGAASDGRLANPADLDDGGEDDDDLAQSAMDESIAEASASMDVSQAAGDESRDEKTGTETRQRGGFITQEDADGEDDGQAPDRDEEPNVVQQSTRAAPTEEEQAEADDDEKKKKVLKSESDGSENGDDDDVQSEELEYFSEDGSDEDSF